MLQGNRWSELIKRGLTILCVLVLIGLIVYMWMQEGIAFERKDQIGAVFNFFIIILLSLVLGIISVLFFLRNIVARFIDSLLAPRKFRDRPAPLISPVKALIKQERYDEALERLDALIETDPETPTLWMMRFDLLSREFNDPEEALRTTETYFVRPGRICSDNNAKLVLRYAELARKLERNNDAIQLLTAELHRSGTGYSRAERKLLENMREALHAEQGTVEKTNKNG